ncbi:hypothetical protein GCM10010193_70950 [Kitasatospora atroaurantiaca]|uniref:Uncharacterized protein n=1 Tax=Kitasatospora atroaurantiaca TaxID=285545 RepID=A0A561ENH8_9ACTN|nr:hypothetical protein [Kitasatospora atroaurantiaca]TWE17178.1 hypothetical protein FB465_2185 [Kitasatospora atroaurantiaca]
MKKTAAPLLAVAAALITLTAGIAHADTTTPPETSPAATTPAPTPTPTPTPTDPVYTPNDTHWGG